MDEKKSKNQRAQIRIRGAVQGVGFRPFVYRLATEMGLAGWVNNSAQGVVVEVEGPPEILDRFAGRIRSERPPLASIQGLEVHRLDPVGFSAFEVRPSEAGGDATALLLPDIATCDDCFREIFDPSNRRFRYPFTNCTNCGPRFSIIESLPYDRPRTTMRLFEMCPGCRGEYEDPGDRRFHAQPNACPQCGPRLSLWSLSGESLAERDEALARAVAVVRSGRILGIKGLGGFHLIVNAQDDGAVRRLRERKHREEKPFAVMFADLEAVTRVAELSEIERRLLTAPEAPIVLVRRRDAQVDLVAPSVAPRNPYLGAMLPYTPLHHLFMARAGIPVVATSGNLTDEPICTDEREALRRLGEIADLLLVHDRPIVRPVEDSVVRVVNGRELVVRRSRGYAPFPFPVETTAPPVLAVGGQLKNAIAVTAGSNIFVSQYIGDLESRQANHLFREVIESFKGFYHVKPEVVACDLHPDYPSTQYAAASGVSVFPVQHHHAHVVSCMAENQLTGTVLGVAWDGTGYGPDGTIWGGEFLVASRGTYRRVARLRPFRLPGSGAAVKEPRRSAMGLLYEILGEDLFHRNELAPIRAFSPEDRTTLRKMLTRKINAPQTSSAGRLFDGVASLLKLRQKTSFEGQAAMELEFSADTDSTDGAYPISLPSDPKNEAKNGDGFLIDWEGIIRGVIFDLTSGRSAGFVARKFHNSLADAIVAVARRVGQARVVLSGGCFQNRLLAESAIRKLEPAGFSVYWHQRIPPNDGGIALGQTVVALHHIEKRRG